MISEETIDRIYENAKLGHDYQLHTLTKAQVIALIDRLRKAEKQTTTYFIFEADGIVCDGPAADLFIQYAAFGQIIYG